MKRKFISALLTLAVATMSLSSLAVNAAGEGKVEFTADQAQVSAGETFTYTLSVPEAQTIKGIQAGIYYDDSKLEVENYEFNEAITLDAYASSIDASNGKAVLAATFSEPVEIEGDIAVFTFKVKDNAASGALDFGLTENGVKLVNMAGEEEDAEASLGMVSVKYDYSAELKATVTDNIVYNNSEVLYTLSMTELADMRGIAFSIGYDTDLLTFASAEAVGMLDDAYTSDIKTDENGIINVAADYSEPVSIKDDILRLKFKVNENQPEGQYFPLTLNSFEAVTAEKETADIDLSFSSDRIYLFRQSVITMSYTPDKASVKQGKTVDYIITLDSIAASRGFQAELDYDPEVLTPVEVTKGSVLEDAAVASGISVEHPGKVDIVCAYDTEMVEIGEVAVITFRVSETAVDGYAELSALDALAVDGSYNYVDARSINNIEPVYIGRKAQSYVIAPNADKNSYAIGDTVYLSVSMGDVSEFPGVQFKINYNTDLLEYIAPSRKSEYYGSVLRASSAKEINSSKADEGFIEILSGFGTSDPYTGEGDICTLCFKVIGNGPANAEFLISDITPKNGDTIKGETESISIVSATFRSAIEAIDEIGSSVNVENIETVRAAKELYESLSDEEKELVENIKALENALDALPVVEKIGDLDNITVESKAAIDEARADYDALTETEKAYVGNISDLVAAETVYAEIETKIQSVIDKINGLGDVTIESKAAIDEARADYDALTEAEKTRVTNYAALIEAEAAYEAAWEALNVYSYSYTKADNKINVCVTNNKSDSDTPMIITAQYNSDGALVGLNVETLTLAKGSTTVYTYDLKENCTDIKCMLWDDLSVMQPYNN
ncbi:MAG: hypothetical protein IJH37_08495 [Clostridia bacterium]|nr:hypothetical protein [Clostridia bacterium]